MLIRTRTSQMNVKKYNPLETQGGGGVEGRATLKKRKGGGKCHYFIFI